MGPVVGLGMTHRDLGVLLGLGLQGFLASGQPAGRGGESSTSDERCHCYFLQGRAIRETNRGFEGQSLFGQCCVGTASRMISSTLELWAWQAYLRQASALANQTPKVEQLGPAA